MEKGKKYTFCFKGEILPEFEVKTVKQNIAQIFGVHHSEVSPLFEGKSIFQRSGLNKFTANQYFDKFKRMGALCSIELEADILPVNEPDDINQPIIKQPIIKEQDKIDKSLCPKCQSSNINSEQCPDCGIYLEKFRKIASMSANAESVSKDDDHDEVDGSSLEQMQKAIIIIRYVIIYFLIVFTVDNFIRDYEEKLRYIIGTGLDISVIPYILGHIGLVYGCYFLALAKGRSGIWGGLGLASLPGLSVLLLLPNRYASNSDSKAKLFAITMIVLSAFWVTNYVNKIAEKSKFIDESIALRGQRHEYPSTVYDTNPDVFMSEIDELGQFLDKGFELLSKYDYRGRQVAAIADVMFAETIRLFIWANYQRYLQYRNGERGTDYLQDKNITHFQIELFKTIKKRVEDVGFPGLFYAYEAWFIGSDFKADGYDFLAIFNGALFESQRKYLRLPLTDKDRLAPPEFSFENIDLSMYSNVKVSTEEDIILFDLSEHTFPATHKTLAIAYYYKVYRQYDVSKRKQVDRYLLMAVQISPDFPNKYIDGYYSVFKPVDIYPLLDKR
ncbi:hypothetical protein MNBD_GAMMA25-2252 [hydrothermal vent metagenome]|uniref:Uncharacterized protein n=1 Tax=hydrothermal vent metagenome TaxID=652676 RepID=A0A3B1B9U7_9ZZZZ